MRVGVISDTHNFFDPKIARIFNGVEHILHAGDIGGRSIIRQLEAIAPVTAVTGNTDDPGMGCRNTEILTLESTKFLLHHIANPNNPADPIHEVVQRVDPNVVIFGHTHKPHEQVVGRVLFLNPGYAGKQRFTLPRSVAILTCGPKGIRAQTVWL